MDEQLRRLATLVHQRNEVAIEITQIIGRPAIIGHIGEFIAARVFDIALYESASHKGADGIFKSSQLQGRSVDIKWYAKREGLLDLKTGGVPDYYLVLTGPQGPAASSRGEARLWGIDGVYLFDHSELVADLRRRGLRIGIASSVKQSYWDAAEIYPRAKNPLMHLSSEQREMLELFRR